jgi:rhamnose transport system ATP-binding protein
MPLLQLKGVTKEFTGTRALADVSLELNTGEIVGLIGENGAGKSTLIKILAGVHRPDEGTILWQGRGIHFRNPHTAIAAGVATIHQELAYFEKLTVAENLLMGEAWPRLGWGGIDWKRLNQLASERLAACELQIDPHAIIQSLSPAQRQEIAIARALSQKAKLLILDEPTASLTEPEVERLVSHLTRLKKHLAILYVSHRLDEIMTLTDRVVVLRDGKLAAEYSTSEASIERMVRDMVGRQIAGFTRRVPEPRGELVFRARELSRSPLFDKINLEVHAGEVVGLAGLVGAGRSEFARAIFGLYQATSGSMQLRQKSFAPRNPSRARALGVAYLPEERKRQGFVLDHSLRSAISISLLDRISRIGWIAGSREDEIVSDAIGKFRIKAQTTTQPIGTLSGGNQQKALLARCVETDPQFLILDEPTRGVDIGAKVEIHNLISQAARDRKAILLISSDLPELLALSDRIVILHRGKMAGEFAGNEATQEKVLLAASGF